MAVELVNVFLWIVAEVKITIYPARPGLAFQHSYTHKIPALLDCFAWYLRQRARYVDSIRFLTDKGQAEYSMFTVSRGVSGKMQFVKTPLTILSNITPRCNVTSERATINLSREVSALISSTQRQATERDFLSPPSSTFFTSVPPRKTIERRRQCETSTNSHCRFLPFNPHLFIT